MVIVECPLCKEDVDLGRYELWQEEPEIFECPYCHEDFEWTSWDELERLDDLGRTEISNLKGAEFLRSIKNQRAQQNHKFPMLVGNRRARWINLGIWEVIVLICLLPLLPIYALFFVFGFLSDEIKRVKYRREFRENVLNPLYLRGTGLVVFSDLSAELVAKRGVPRYIFEKEDITGIVLHEESHSHGTSDYFLEIYLHGFYAMSLYGFNKNDAKIIVSQLMTLYDIDFRYTHHYSRDDFGGGGSGGG